MVKEYDVVQINQEHEWVGCFVTVTEVKKWGIQGFVQVPLQGQAYIRVKHGEYELIGEAILIPNDVETDE